MYYGMRWKVSLMNQKYALLKYLKHEFQLYPNSNDESKFWKVNTFYRVVNSKSRGVSWSLGRNKRKHANETSKDWQFQTGIGKLLIYNSNNYTEFQGNSELIIDDAVFSYLLFNTNHLELGKANCTSSVIVDSFDVSP